MYNVASQSGEWTSRINGTQHFTTATNTPGFASSAIQLGVSSSGNPHWLMADVAELIIYDHVLATGDRDTVETYIADEYGLTIAGCEPLRPSGS